MSSPVFIAPRKSLTRAQRVRIFDAAHGVCDICGAPIRVGEPWHVEHPIPHAMGGSDNPSELRPVHILCHGIKTGRDVRAIAKSTRVRAKHLGIKKHSGSGFRGHRKFNGDIVWKRG